MRILYAADHRPHDNDDEGAIAHALERLGHTVLRVHEKPTCRQPSDLAQEADFCLFHKWAEVHSIRELSQRVPVVFWFFDMVDSTDPTLVARAQHRVAWMQAVTPHVSVGFCTDGDWVARDTTGKLVHLMQGADERTASSGSPKLYVDLPVLFCGMINHGQRRASHIAELRARYKDKFHVIGDVGPTHRIHGRALADTLASAGVVVAPDGPSTDRYWSNRVYQTLGFGAFLVHPRCEKLAEHYEFGKELAVYSSRQECFELIDRYLDDPLERAKLAARGYLRTHLDNLYRHRCQELISVVQERCV